MDGWVVVGTKLDTKQLEKDLKQAERRLEQYEKEAEKLTKSKAKAKIDLKPYEEAKKMIQQMTDEANRYAQTEQEVTKNLNFEQKQLEDLNLKYSKQLTNLNEINLKIKENAKNQGLVKTQIEETNQKLSKSKGIGNIQDIMENINKSTSNTIKKIGRWTLAIFSVRTAYGGIRNAMSTLSEYNEKMTTQLNSIRLIFATALEPIINRIISLVNTLLNYINYIAKAWFNVDLFANASAKAMQKGAGSAEKMRKSLAGFDEMNVISDTSSSAGGGTSTGFETPEDVPIPSWIQWIADNKDIVIAGLLGIAGGLTAINLELKLIQGLGIGLILAGVALAIQGIIDFIKDPSWDNFLTILMGISLVVAGIAVLMGGWIVALTALGVAIVTYIIKNWDKVKEILSKVGSWIYEKVIKPVADFFVKLWDGIKNGVKSAVDWVKEKFNSIVTFFSNIISKIVGLFKKIGTKVGDAIGGAFKAVINGVLKTIEGILNTPINTINKLINVINKVPGIDIGKLPTFNLPRLAVGGVVNMPGRGINYNGANIGERGAEGVIPLTNSQMMAQLGEAIGRYININATVPVYVGNRQVAREIKKISADNDFAFNK